MDFLKDLDRTLNRAASIAYKPIRDTATSIEKKAQEANKVLADNFDPANPFVRLGKDINEHTQGAAHLIAHPVSTTKQIIQSVPQQVESVKQFAKDPVGNTVNYFSDPYNKPLAPLDIALTAAGGVELAGAAGNVAKNASNAVTKTVVPKTQVVYHGSPTQGINNLSTKYVGSNTGMTRSGWGVNFTPDPVATDFYKVVSKYTNNMPSNFGETYTVRIPTDDVLLDFNKTLSQQPEAVQNFAKNHLGEKSFNAIKDVPEGGKKLYESLGTPEEASKILDSKGILGNKNIDFDSPEIVIYNDKNMHIINRANNKQTLMDKGRDLWYGLRDKE